MAQVSPNISDNLSDVYQANELIQALMQYESMSSPLAWQNVPPAVPAAPFVPAINTQPSINKHHKYKTHYVYNMGAVDWRNDHLTNPLVTGCGTHFSQDVEQGFKQTANWDEVTCKLCKKARKKLDNPLIGMKMHFLLPYEVGDYFKDSKSLCGVVNKSYWGADSPTTEDWDGVTCGLCIRGLKAFRDHVGEAIAQRKRDMQNLQDQIKNLSKISGATDHLPSSALVLAGRILDLGCDEE